MLVEKDRYHNSSLRVYVWDLIVTTVDRELDKSSHVSWHRNGSRRRCRSVGVTSQIKRIHVHRAAGIDRHLARAHIHRDDVSAQNDRVAGAARGYEFRYTCAVKNDR